MSDIFSNFEPVDGNKMPSGDFGNVKPFFASPNGPSRLFTATYKGKKVILKTLKPEFAQEEQYRESLKKEYEITSQFDYKFIRKAMGFETIQDLGECIILEYVEGKSLAEHIRVGTLNEKEVKYLLIDLCDALIYMHQRGVYHCNLRPENILVTNEGHAKVIDIGLPETEYKTDHELLIKENEVIAPELIKGEEPDPRSDVYSLGKIIEFIIERNMIRQFKSVATHCTQFSREQRFDSVAEVKSLLTKGYSVAKLIIVILVLLALGAAAYVYVPKFIEKSKIEKEERLAVDFEHEVEKINAQTQTLCEKYHVNSLDEPLCLPDGWKADSVRLSQQLAPFFEVESLKQKAAAVIQNQKQAVIQNRQREIDALQALQKQAADSIAEPAN